MVCFSEHSESEFELNIVNCSSRVVVLLIPIHFLEKCVLKDSAQSNAILELFGKHKFPLSLTRAAVGMLSTFTQKN